VGASFVLAALAEEGAMETQMSQQPPANWASPPPGAQQAQLTPEQQQQQQQMLQQQQQQMMMMQQQQMMMMQQQQQQQMLQQQQMMMQPQQHAPMTEEPVSEPTWSGCGGVSPVCVDEGTVGVVQRCGAYQGWVAPGMVWICPLMHTVTPVSIAMKQEKIDTDCKTKDNVTVTVTTAVQYYVERNRVEEAVFIVEDGPALIRTGVNNVVRSELPGLDLDEAYENKEALAKAVLEKIRPAMQEVGYYIRDILVTDLHPDRMVLQSMNAINASQRQRQASVEQGEAQKVLLVKKAEAESESKYLSGTGLSRMRLEIARGFKQSMDAMHEGGLSAKESMNMLITTQYVDMLKDFAMNPNKSAIMIPK